MYYSCLLNIWILQGLYTNCSHWSCWIPSPSLSHMPSNKPNFSSHWNSPFNCSRKGRFEGEKITAVPDRLEASNTVSPASPSAGESSQNLLRVATSQSHNDPVDACVRESRCVGKESAYHLWLYLWKATDQSTCWLLCYWCICHQATLALSLPPLQAFQVRSASNFFWRTGWDEKSCITNWKDKIL